MGVSSRIGKQLAPRVTGLAPGLTSSFVREALSRAISGVGPLPGAAKAADAQLAEQKGDVDKAIKELIENHVRYAGAQGFATNLGGLVTMALLVPANITGLALLQCRLVAGIAHLRGYDLDDPRVRNAILACLLGQDSVDELVKKRKLPAPPMALATSPVHDPALDEQVASAVTTELVAKVGGRRVATFVGRRIPLLGGGVGAASDAMSTYQIGQYVSREMRDRRGTSPAA